MPFVKDPLSLLIETSKTDLINTSRIVKESTALSGYAGIGSVSEAVVYDPSMVTVVRIDNEYFTEMNFLYPYMRSNGISSIAEALYHVAEANNLPRGAVGLLIESDEQIECNLKEAKSNKKKNAVVDKIDKAVELKDKLKDKGIEVKKKLPLKDDNKKNKKVCPKCKKDPCKCN